MVGPVSAGIIEQYREFWRHQNNNALLYIKHQASENLAHEKGLVKPWMTMPSEWWGFAEAVNLAYNSGDFTYVRELLDLIAYEIKQIGYAGVGYPMFKANLGAGSLAAMITGFSRLGDNTVWFELDEPWPYDRIISVDSFSPYADTIRLAMQLATEYLGGLAVISQNDLGGLADVLSSLRRNDGFLYDLYDNPNEVKQALDTLKKLWFRAYEETDALLKPVNGGLHTHWINLLSEEPYYPHQCDACALFGPEHFRELILPSLADEMVRFPATAYHLDGSAQICHLDALCESPTLKVIQWVPEPNTLQNDEQYYPLYRQIIENGRKIAFTDWRSDAADLRRFFKVFPCEAFFISLWANDTSECTEYLQIAEGK